MANLIPCPDCGKEISPHAPSCPNCGRPKNPPNPYTSVDCPDCHNPVQFTASHCPHCGRETNWHKQQEAWKREEKGLPPEREQDDKVHCVFCDRYVTPQFTVSPGRTIGMILGGTGLVHPALFSTSPGSRERI